MAASASKKTKFEEFCPFKALQNTELKAANLVKVELMEMLKTMKRRMTSKRSFRNPWSVKLDRHVPYGIFLEFYKVFNDLRDKRGILTVHAEYKTKPAQMSHLDKPMFKRMVVAFVDKQRAKKLLGRLGIDTDQYFSKELNNGNLTAMIKINHETPLEFYYDGSSRKAVLSAGYKVVNEFGITI